MFEATIPFKFFTRLHLSELTGLRASTLTQLLDCIKKVPASSIYYHTHAFFQEYQYMAKDSPNDFAYWVTEILGEAELGERLSGIDIMRYTKIHELQDAIAQTIEEYLHNNALAALLFVRRKEEFHFIKSTSFVLPTPFVAYTLQDFAEVLKKVGIGSIYFHVFEARLRLAKPTNDFSAWIGQGLGDRELADKIAGLDPYARTLEELRSMIIGIVERRMVGGLWQK